METFPNDVSVEIFSRLPAKSVARFRTLSKQWGSTLESPDFSELFRSSARPRLLFAVERWGQWSFFSSPQSSSASSSALEFHSKFSGDASRFICSYGSGLVYFPNMFMPNEGSYSMSVVCNPVTGKYVRLPEVSFYRKSRTFVGFDPIDRQFKLLAEDHTFCSQRDHHQVLTLGEAGELTWRTKKMDCPPYDSCLSEGICVNGVVYYLAANVRDLPLVIVSFDVRTEEFKFIEAECFPDDDTTKLISYKGKLGGINWKYAKSGERIVLELSMWVLEDVETKQWVKSVYTLTDDRIVDRCNFSVVGMTATGEIVLSMDYTCKPFFVCYFDPERSTLRSVEIQGFGDSLEALESRGRVHVFVDHVEDLNVNDAKQFKPVISAPSDDETD